MDDYISGKFEAHNDSDSDEIGDFDEDEKPVDHFEDFKEWFIRFIVISPENMFFHIWNIFVIAVCIFSSIKYAIYAAFREDVDYSSYIDYYREHDFSNARVHSFTIEDIHLYDNL